MGQLVHGETTGWRRNGVSTEYVIWVGMVQRCTNPSNESFPRYGGRGITVCMRWLASFADFLADVGRRPSKRHSLDRKDNEKGYCPENCVWSDGKSQCRNTRRNRWLAVYGIKKTVAEWAELTGLPYGRISARIHAGFPPEMCLSVGPLKSKGSDGVYVRASRQDGFWFYDSFVKKSPDDRAAALKVLTILHQQLPAAPAKEGADGS